MLTWVRLSVSAPCSLALLAAFWLYHVHSGGTELKSVYEKQSEIWDCSWMTVALCFLCALLWTFFSGIGGFFYQNDDFYGRNAIFHDLLEHEWPVRFAGTPYALTYYVGFWIVPALIGKVCAGIGGPEILWLAANYALFAETVWFLFLLFLLFLSLLNVQSVIRAGGFLLLFVLFSGMDGLVCLFRNDWTDQIEWWAQTWQYSSHTTCLFWVFNQAVPTWLVTVLLLCLPERTDAYAMIGLLALPYAPLPLVGIVLLCVGMFTGKILEALHRRGEKEAVQRVLIKPVSLCNILSILGSVPCFLYLSSNASTRNAPFRVDMFLNAYSLPESVGRLLVFSLVEWGLYALILASVFHKDAVFRTVVLSLLIIPVFRVGYNMDFSMRASLPGLFVLSVYCARFLRDWITRKKILSGCLVVALLIGSITPMLEFRRGMYKVVRLGMFRQFSDPFKTVLHPYADTENFICTDTDSSFFYRHIARK
ncbi:MAG: hypothetical protein IJ088_01515 [Clostridia bacterium]|nr:hypothetical protein [Clostridia bacterium]